MQDFEGTLILEKLAAIGKVEAFLDAIDSDNLTKASKLMQLAGISAALRTEVIRKAIEGEES